MKKMKLNIQRFSVPYTYLEFEDLPSTNTPISATNLNTMQDSIHTEVSSVVEKGSNANGGYLKYENGALICYASKDLQFGFTQQETSVGAYSSGKIPLNNFPIEFIDVPTITGSVTKASGQWMGWWSGVFEDISVTNPGKVEFFRVTSTPADVVRYTINYVAIGRWK